MDNHQLDDELGEFLKALQRRWYVVLGAIVQFAILAYLLSSLQTPMYRSSATVLVEPSAAQSTLEAGLTNNNGIRGRSITNEILFARSGVVLDRLGDAIGEDDLDQLKKKLDVAGDSESDYLEFTVSDTDPDVAADIANTWATIYVEQKQQAAANSLSDANTLLTSRLVALQNERDDLRKDLNALLLDRAQRTDPEAQARVDAQIQAEQTRIAPQDAVLEAQIDSASASLVDLSVATDLAETGTARIVTAALPPDEASNVAPARNLAIGIILGTIVGLILVRLLSRRDDRVSNAADIETDLGLPVLAAIPKPSRETRKGETALAVAEHPGLPMAEAYNQLRTSLAFVNNSDEGRVPILITSATPSEGKTTTSSNLSLAAANAGQRTTLIDLDLRRPRVHEAYGLSQRPGFSDAAEGDYDYSQIKRDFEGFPLSIITAGTPSRNPASIISSPQATEIVDTAVDHNDFVVLDTPPVLAVSDASSIAASTGALSVLVVRAGKTTLADAREAVKRLERAGSRVAGVVLVGVSNSGSSGRSYYGSDSHDTHQPIDLVAVVQRQPRQRNAPQRVPRTVSGDESSSTDQRSAAAQGGVGTRRYASAPGPAPLSRPGNSRPAETQRTASASSRNGSRRSESDGDIRSTSDRANAGAGEATRAGSGSTNGAGERPSSQTNSASGTQPTKSPVSKAPDSASPPNAPISNVPASGASTAKAATSNSPTSTAQTSSASTASGSTSGAATASGSAGTRGSNSRASSKANVGPTTPRSTRPVSTLGKQESGPSGSDSGRSSNPKTTLGSPGKGSSENLSAKLEAKKTAPSEASQSKTTSPDGKPSQTGKGRPPKSD